MVRLLRLLILLFVLIVGLAFHARNGQTVTLDLYVSRVTAPASLIVAGSLAAGALLGVLVAVPRLLLQRRVIARLQRALRRTAPASLAPPASPVTPAADAVASRDAA